MARHEYDLSVAPTGSPAGLFLVADGLTFQEAPAFVYPRAQVIIRGPFKLDLSYQNIVSDAHLQRVVRQAREIAEERVEALALQLPIEETLLDFYAWMAAQWRRERVSDKRDLLQARVAEAFHDRDDLRHPFVLQVRRKK